MNILIFDTETTGILDRSLPIEDPRQARIMQLAAKLITPEREVIDQLCTYIKPEKGWPEIHPKAFEAHGITLEKCEADGIPMLEALGYFNKMKAQCITRVGFNISFDKQMLLREAMAYGTEHNSDGLQDFCVMKHCQPIMNMAPSDRMLAAGMKGNKPPKLIEAYNYFFGRDFHNAHDAMGDVDATMEIYFALQDRGLIEKPLN